MSRGTFGCCNQGCGRSCYWHQVSSGQGCRSCTSHSAQGSSQDKESPSLKCQSYGGWETLNQNPNQTSRSFYFLFYISILSKLDWFAFEAQLGVQQSQDRPNQYPTRQFCVNQKKEPLPQDILLPSTHWDTVLISRYIYSDYDVHSASTGVVKCTNTRLA